MWTCPRCNRKFLNTHQVHSCLDKNLDDFLRGKTPHTTELFHWFIKEYQAMGDISVHPTKSMIVIVSTTRLAYIIQLGKIYMDVVFPFKEPYIDNYCFVKIKQVPGTNDYNHHFRMCFKEDINEEVKFYMNLTLRRALS